MAEPGTLEQIALILGDAFSPLAQRLQPDRALELFGDLGLNLPTSAISAQLQSAFGAAATAAGELPQLVGDLNASISADESGLQIGAKAAPVVAKVVTLIGAFTTISKQVESLNVPGFDPADLTTFASNLPVRLLDLVVIDYLSTRQTTFSSLLSLLGVVKRTQLNAGSVDPLHPQVELKSLDFGRIGDFFQSPEQLAADLYGWSQPGFDATVLLERLYDLLVGVGLPVARGAVGPALDLPAIEIFLATIAQTDAAVNPPGLELTVNLDVGDGFALTYPIASGLELDVRAHGALKSSASVRIQPPANVTIVPPPAATAQGDVTAGIARVPATGEETVTLFGVAGATRLQTQRIGLALKALFAWDAVSGQAKGNFGIEGRIEQGKLVISLADADGFIGAIMSGFSLEASFDLGFGWTAGGGVYFTGSAGLEVQVPSHISLGPSEITAITLRIGVSGGAFPIDLTANVKGALGPIQAVIEGIGTTATLSFPADHKGNLGPVQLSFGFKPPKGVGLSLDVGVVKGGGYLSIDVDRGEYAGALELVFADFLIVQAIGLINTKNPDGSPGFSMLIVITAEFPGGIQLGFGFTLLGVGGIVGVNRTMNLQALMEGVRTNAVESVMFPHDVVANAPRILSDLRTFFPPRQGKFLIGPMVKLGWGTPTLISAAVGIIIEIPGNIAIVGVVKIALPAEDAALLVLQVNFAGAIEFDKSRLYFFASLYESRVLFITIEGELGLLVAWGDDANFVLSVGGFHPRFTPPPLPFPSPKRVALDIVNTPYARIRVSGYFAVTSNTAQFGAHADLFFGLSVVSIEGYIGFDALFQFSPFFFIVEISAGVSLKVFGLGLFGISLHFSLEGPTPWRAKGSGSISFFFFDVSADFDITWGDTQDTALEPADVFPSLIAELNKPIAWQAHLPQGANLLVSLRPLGDGGGADDSLVLHPVGTLEVRQKAVPLDLTIAKVGNKAARDANRFALSVHGGLSKHADVDEQFALAQFLKMDDAGKLSRPAFERQHGGVELSVDGATSGSARMVRRIVRYEEVIIDNRFRRRAFRFREVDLLLFEHFLGGNSMARSSLSAANKKLRDPLNDAIVAHATEYVVASTINNTMVAGTVAFTSHAAATDHLAGLVGADANMAASIHVIPAVEAVLV